MRIRKLAASFFTIVAYIGAGLYSNGSSIKCMGFKDNPDNVVIRSFDEDGDGILFDYVVIFEVEKVSEFENYYKIGLTFDQMVDRTVFDYFGADISVCIKSDDDLTILDGEPISKYWYDRLNKFSIDLSYLDSMIFGINIASQLDINNLKIERDSLYRDFKYELIHAIKSTFYELV